MLAEMTFGNWISGLGIVVPLLVGALAFIWRSKERQNAQIVDTSTRTTVLETQVKDHKEGLEKGDAKFEGVATQIGALQQEAAATGATVTSIQATQTSMDGKLDDLLARGSGS